MAAVGGPSAPGLAYDPSKHTYHPVPSDVYRDPESLEETPLAETPEALEETPETPEMPEALEQTPGMSLTENSLHWAIIMFNGAIPARNFVPGNVAVQIVFALLPFGVMIPLYIYRNEHPVNLALLAAFTFCLEFTLMAACSIYALEIVLEAMPLGAAIVGGLLAYSVYTTKKGKDFTFMGPMLFSALSGMVIWGFIQIFFRPVPVVQTIHALLGSFLFSAYIVYDMHLFTARFSLYIINSLTTLPPDYIWALMTPFLDVINLYLYILQLLGRSQRN